MGLPSGLHHSRRTHPPPSPPGSRTTTLDAATARSEANHRSADCYQPDGSVHLVIPGATGWHLPPGPHRCWCGDTRLRIGLTPGGPLDGSSSVLAHLVVQRVEIAWCRDAELVSAHQGVPHFVQRVHLDLTCPLSCHPESVADLVQGLRRHAYAVVGADDDAFAMTQSLCQLAYFVLLDRVEHRVVRPFGGNVRDQIAHGGGSLGVPCAAGLLETTRRTYGGLQVFQT